MYSCRYPTKLTGRVRRASSHRRANSTRDESEALKSIEENCFCWNMFREPKNAQVCVSLNLFDGLQQGVITS